MLKKLLAILTVVVGLGFGAQMIEPGLNLLSLSTSDSVIHGGETLKVFVGSFLNVRGLSGICVFSIQVDSCADCSTKVEVGIYEGASESEFDVITSCWSMDGKNDHDTIAEIPFLPAPFWQIWIYDANSNNDSLRVRGPLWLYVVGN